MPRPIPELYALVLCDTAFQQAGTGKWFVIGTFHGFGVPQIPVHTPMFMLFLSLGDFAGDANLQIRVLDPQDGELCTARGRIPQMDLGTFEVAFPIPPLRLEREGTFGVELTVAGQVVARRGLEVKIQPMPTIES